MTAQITAHVATWKTNLWLTARGVHADELRVERWLQRLLDEEIARLDAAASRFRADSELSAVNRGAGHWVEVSWYFVAVLTAALRAARATRGLVDPTLGHEVADAGYDRWASQDSGLGRSRPRPADCTWRAVEIRPGREQARVRIPDGVALDLGSVAKGWLADRLATTVRRSLGYDALANAGGDLRCVSSGEPWTVWAEPDEVGTAASAVDLIDAGLATSGVGRRRWENADGPGHHIIDPRTGRPALVHWTSASVVAADGAGANAAATAALILAAEAPGWLRRKGLDAWLVGSGRDERVGSWPAATEAVA